jgi:hypothetical protein
MSESVRAVGEDEPQGVINGATGADHDEAERDLQQGAGDEESDEYDEEEAEYEEEKQIVGDDDDDEDEDYEEGDEEDNEGGEVAGKSSMTHLLIGNPNAPDGDDFEDEDEDEDDDEYYQPEAPVATKKRSREELGEDDAQDSKKVKA